MRAVAALLVLLGGCRDADLERMVDQPRFRPYQPCAWFDDGMVMREPPPGAVPRGAAAEPRAVREGEDDRGDLARIPVAVTRELVVHGRQRYAIFCGVCHGEEGDGKSEVAKSMTLRPPPSLHQPSLVAMKPGQLYRVISHGYGLMRSYAPELAVRDRWAVVAYVRALQKSRSHKLAELPPALQEEARRWLP